MPDTDWVIHYLNGQPAIVSKLQERQKQGVGVSLISLAELYGEPKRARCRKRRIQPRGYLGTGRGFLYSETACLKYQVAFARCPGRKAASHKVPLRLPRGESCLGLPHFVPRGRPSDDVGNFEDNVWESKHRDRVLAFQSYYRFVGFSLRFTIDQQHIVLEVFNPYFWNAGRGIMGKFDIPVITKRGIGNLNHEQNILAPNAFCAVRILARLQQNDVWLRFSVFGQPNRILNADDDLSAKSSSESGDSSIYAPSMPATDRAHLDDLAVDELDSVLWTKNASFRHSVVVINSEQLLCRFDSHIFWIIHQGNERINRLTGCQCN